MRGRTDITFKVDDPDRVYKALAPEAEDAVQRSEVRLETCQEGIRLEIESEDLVSLRAALNTWIRLVDIAMEMVLV
ncbi:KEOPS complex subunit Pcc1 [Methanocrinis sp.]|uniref:KEOPS complex subunit Pcc1 n=1 Tax=Methanocrinis sp. TaxID=3101522 RepID=UPI003D0B3A0A